MKKLGICLILILVFISSVIFGYYIYEKGKYPIDNSVELSEITEGANKSNENTLNRSLITTNSMEEKISPNATLIIKKHYQECGHTTKEYAEIPSELVNMTEEELREELKDWQIKGFSPEEVVILKEVAGICNEHYTLREKEGVIAIYIENSDGKETLSELTEISTEYLTENDLAELKEGIKAIGKEKLNSLLEDYE